MVDSRSFKQLAIDLRRRAKGFPFSSEDRKLLIAAAEALEQKVESKAWPYLSESYRSAYGANGIGLEAILEFLEEKGVPLTPEQKAKLEIDNDHE